jgi:hypothetical protein
MGVNAGYNVQPLVTKVAPAVDWLTATWKHEDVSSAHMLQLAIALGDTIAQMGNESEVFQWQGYSGRKIGSYFLGEREDGYVVRVSGSTAHFAFTSIYHPNMHVSRLDLCVTVWLSPSVPGLGLDATSQARMAKLNGSITKRPVVTHYESDDGGFTLYLGRRNSRSMARLYNKEVESGEEYYKGAWRYECELHNEVATKTAYNISRSLFPLEETISAAVWRYYRERGVNPIFEAYPDRGKVVLPKRETTSLDRSLLWLEKQVRPTVARLVALGYTSSVLTALGLPGGDVGHSS